MKKKLSCILLVDDDPDDNHYHQIIIKRMNIVEHIDIAANGIEALAYLRNEANKIPDIIFLDLNMPKMNGWEFLEKYKDFSPEKKAKVLVVILTTSANPDDVKKGEEVPDVTRYETKPLTDELMSDILQKYFPDHI